MSAKAKQINCYLAFHDRDCAASKNRLGTACEMPKLDRCCRSDLKDHFKLVEELFIWIDHIKHTLNSARRDEIDHDSNGLAPVDVGNDFTSVWPAFVSQLRSMAATVSLNLGYLDNFVDDLELDLPFWAPNT